MAWTDGHWCFIHIPKTSGGWVTRVLGAAKRDGPAHGMPTRWDYSMVFTVVRDPADWLRSAWGNRLKEKWAVYPRMVPWYTFVRLANKYRTSDFNQFAAGLERDHPGIIEWLFDSYSPPGVKVVRYGPELYQFLRDLGRKPDGWKPHNVSNTHGYDISKETRNLIYKAERSLYEKYGWNEDGSYD